MLEFLSVSSKKSKDKHIKWVCKCSCGDVSEYIATRVRHNRVSNCKKCASKASGEKSRTHGMGRTSTYHSWLSMKDRCLNEKSKDYPNYGGAGLTVCKEWATSFEEFYLDMGEKPAGCSIDRIDNTQGYWKENCRWATRSDQQRNKKKSCTWVVKGIMFNTMKEAAGHFGVSEPTIGKWVNGWYDKREDKHWSPRNDCKRIPKY